MSSSKASRGIQAQSFIRNYPSRLPALRALAHHVEMQLQDALEPTGIEVHQIAARAKLIESVVEKIRRKGYGKPSSQLTDQVGGRVIVYYAEDVDRAADAIRERFEYDERRSVDKRTELGLRKFGYRSVHILIRLGKGVPSGSDLALGRMWIEIQVRSILEHSWAEIEHEICYKSGANLPDEILRRFSALAGVLELLDNQFSTIRAERERRLDAMRQDYIRGRDLDVPLDAWRLTAFMEAERPNGTGWRSSDGWSSLPQKSDSACAEALAASGVATGRRVRKEMSTRGFRKAANAFAGDNQIGVGEVSHFAICVLIALLHRPELIASYQDLLQDPLLRSALIDGLSPSQRKRLGLSK